ncbi:dihydroxyacetone kinase [Fulvitalea axinellae]|uniref:Dihydroxyacetone kinase n=1 Tax=Fulvitalea axinellae TaxID=1182444 RepID=A0AAU9CTA3_9BACT|nr:dihydroxyacetone kinase [Fulvitalea axinellae]
MKKTLLFTQLLTLLLTVSCVNRKGPKKILFVFTSHNQLGNTGKPTGFFLSEASHAYQTFDSAGFHIDFCSVKGGVTTADDINLSDPINKSFWNNTGIRKKLRETKKIDRINPSTYSAIYLVGGHGSVWDFPDDKSLARVTAHIYNNGGVVSAVCHGTAGLLNVKLPDGKFLIDGKKIATFTNSEEAKIHLDKVVPFLLETELRNRNAYIIHGTDFQPNIQVDGRLITGQNPASAKGVSIAVINALKDQAKH